MSSVCSFKSVNAYKCFKIYFGEFALLVDFFLLIYKYIKKKFKCYGN